MSSRDLGDLHKTFGVASLSLCNCAMPSSAMRLPSAPLLRATAQRAAPIVLAMPSSGGGASEQQCTVALVKNIVGTGVLTLPCGISQLSTSGASSEDALAYAAAFAVFFCAVNAYGFILIGEACSATGEASYVGAWRKTLGSRTSFLPALFSLLLCFTAGVSCASVIADTFTDLVAALLATDYEELSRTVVLGGTAATVLLPLCLLPSLAPLGTASLVGVAGVFITGGTMIVRLLDGSYGSSGAFVDAAVWHPAFHTAADMAAPVAPDLGSVCVFASLLSNAFLAHYNAPAVYSELGPYVAPTDSPAADGAVNADSAPSIGRLRLAARAETVNQQFREFIEATKLGLLEAAGRASRRPADESSVVRIKAGSLEDGLVATQLSSFRRVVVWSYAISGVLFLVIAGAGFATFGDASQPLILNNYASADPLAAVARLGVGLSVLVEFPLLERPFRLTTIQLLGIEAQPGTPAWVASALLSCLLLCGVAALDIPLDFISALSGSTGGALLIFVAPALMGLRLLDTNSAAVERGGAWRAPLLWALITLGLATGVIGTFDELT